MKKVLTGIVLMLAAQTGYAAKVEMNITGIGSDKGNLIIRVYDQKSHWLSQKKEEIFFSKSVVVKESVKKNQVSTTFELPEGQYAFAVVHDKNANGKLDKNWMGIPKEPVGNSSDIQEKMGPPKYKNALKELKTERVSLDIEMMHF